MTAQEQLTLRTLLVHNESVDADSHSAYRLLHDLGHEVSATASADQALELLGHDRADLVVVDSDRAGQRDFVKRLGNLPNSQQPRQVAIFSEVADDALDGLADRLEKSRVHVLLKPLHMHGLLGVLRSIESRS